MSLRSPVICVTHTVRVPLALFDPYVFVDRVILPERLQQLLGTIDSDILLGFLGTDVATGIDLNVTDFMAGRIAVALGAVSPTVPFGFNASNSSDVTLPFNHSSNSTQSSVLPAFAKPAELVEQLRKDMESLEKKARHQSGKAPKMQRCERLEKKKGELKEQEDELKKMKGQPVGLKKFLEEVVLPHATLLF